MVDVVLKQRARVAANSGGAFDEVRKLAEHTNCVPAVAAQAVVIAARNGASERAIDACVAAFAKTAYQFDSQSSFGQKVIAKRQEIASRRGARKTKDGVGGNGTPAASPRVLQTSPTPQRTPNATPPVAAPSPANTATTTRTTS